MHAEWPIGLQVEGTYHDLGAFLDRVSKFPRIINVGNIQIASRVNRAQRTITADCTATAFVLVTRNRSSRPAPGAAAAGKRRARALVFTAFAGLLGGPARGRPGPARAGAAPARPRGDPRCAHRGTGGATGRSHDSRSEDRRRRGSDLTTGPRGGATRSSA